MPPPTPAHRQPPRTHTGFSSSLLICHYGLASGQNRNAEQRKERPERRARRTPPVTKNTTDCQERGGELRLIGSRALQRDKKNKTKKNEEKKQKTKGAKF